MTKASSVRYATSAVLALGIGVLLWVLLSEENHGEKAKARLFERVDQYIALRLQDDWPKLYDMLHPDHRRKKPIAEFLQIYGTGVLKVHQMDLLGQQVFSNRSALTKLSADLELVKAKLPSVARNLQVPTADAMREQQIFELAWRWVDGEWYWMLGNKELSGLDDQGKPIQIYGNDPSAGSGGQNPEPK